MSKRKKTIPKKLRSKLGGKKKAKKTIGEMDQLGDLLSGFQNMMGGMDPSKMMGSMPGMESPEEKEKKIEEKYKNLFNIKMIKSNSDAILPKESPELKPYNEVYDPSDFVIPANKIFTINLGWNVKGIKEFEICYKTHVDLCGGIVLDIPNRILTNKDSEVHDEYPLSLSIINPFSHDIEITKGSPVAYMYIQPTPACSYIEVETFEEPKIEEPAEIFEKDENGVSLEDEVKDLENEVEEIEKEIKLAEFDIAAELDVATKDKPVESKEVIEEPVKEEMVEEGEILD